MNLQVGRLIYTNKKGQLGKSVSDEKDITGGGGGSILTRRNHSATALASDNS